jgi:hypothetical protein
MQSRFGIQFRKLCQFIKDHLLQLEFESDDQWKKLFADDDISGPSITAAKSNLNTIVDAVLTGKPLTPLKGYT